MEGLVQATNAPAADYFALAQLYLKIGDWNSYDERMRGVLGGQRRPVQPHTSFSTSKCSCRKRSCDDANTWLLTLEKAVPIFSIPCD